MNKAINVGVAEKLGKYSDALQISSGACWLYTSGTPGLNADGTLPVDFESQARLAWKSIIEMLHAADMDVENIVKINQSMLRREDLPAYRKIRDEHFLLLTMDSCNKTRWAYSQHSPRNAEGRRHRPRFLHPAHPVARVMIRCIPKLAVLD